jgi:hypothetical protein
VAPGHESGYAAEGRPGDGRDEDPVAVRAAKAGVPGEVLLRCDQYVLGVVHAVGGVVPAVGDPVVAFSALLDLAGEP